VAVVLLERERERERERKRKRAGRELGLPPSQRMDERTSYDAATAEMNG